MPYSTLPWKNLLAAWIVCSATVFLSGCPAGDRDQKSSEERLAPPGTRLRLLVVDDPELATAVEQLRGEWNAQAGFDFQVEERSEEDLTAAESMAADAVICPTYLLGTLAEEKRILPVPESLVENDEGTWSEIFSLLRVQEAGWGNRAMAVPFGSAVLTCYYRADLLEKLAAQPPATWAEFQKLAERLADRANLGDAAGPADQAWSGAIQPLGPGWAGVVLLARAAGYATHRETLSTLFHIDSMEPLIDGPPFVRALEELVATARLGPADQLTLDPAAVRDAFWEGRCGLALTWPTSSVVAAAAGAAAADLGFPMGIAELPGPTEVYNVGKAKWEACREDEDARVTLLAAGGRLGAVSRECQLPEATFQLLLWLSGDKWSPRVSGASSATTLFRKSHLTAPEAWVEPRIPPDVASEYGLLMDETFGRQRRLFALRIPGRTEYLAALEGAVQRAVEGQSPAEALGKAAAEWREITQRRGVEKQRRAYHASLGIE